MFHSSNCGVSTHASLWVTLLVEAHKLWSRDSSAHCPPEVEIPDPGAGWGYKPLSGIYTHLCCDWKLFVCDIRDYR